MEQGKLVNVWLDRPGNFLEVFWSRELSDCVEPRGLKTPNTKLDIMVDVTESGYVTGFSALGALTYFGKCVDEAIVMAEAQPHPLTIRYDPEADRWGVEWGPGVVACVATVNPRIRARVDAAGLIQGVEIWDLRGFEGEILNQDLEPVELGVGAG